MRVECANCGLVFDCLAGHFNRSKSRGARLFCSQKCSGIGRRKNRSDAEKKTIKAAYDKEYRAKNAEMLKAKKAEYHRKTYDPERAAEERKRRAPYHAEYCRRPEYRDWKSEYDRKYRAGKQYGDWAECFLLTQDIRSECLSVQTDYEIRLAAGTLNKQLQRKRDYERSHGNKPEIGALGNA